MGGSVKWVGVLSLWFIEGQLERTQHSKRWTQRAITTYSVKEENETREPSIFTSVKVYESCNFRTVSSFVVKKDHLIESVYITIVPHKQERHLYSLQVSYWKGNRSPDSPSEIIFTLSDSTYWVV